MYGHPAKTTNYMTPILRKLHRLPFELRVNYNYIHNIDTVSELLK